MYFTLIILFLFILLLLFLFILLLLFLLNLFYFIVVTIVYFILLRFMSCGRDEGWRRAVGHDAGAEEGI